MNSVQKHFNHIVIYDLINKLNLKNIFQNPIINKNCNKYREKK